MLIIDLRALHQGPAHISGEIAAGHPMWEGTRVELLVPLRVDVVAEGSPARGVLVRGAFAGRALSYCRRCLAPVELDAAEEFDLLFDPKTEAGDGDLAVYALNPTADELDLGDTIRERVQLLLPDFALCRKDCLGFCDSCGKNLNEGECGCSEEEIDPRWGPLRALG